MHPLLRKVLKPVFKIIASPGIINPHTPYENELMIAGVKPVAILDSVDVCEKMKELVETGQIVLIGSYQFPSIGLMQVFSQANHVEEGKELYARCYNDNIGYPTLEGKEFDQRIGKLLGYSVNDLNLCDNKIYQLPIVLKILDRTRDYRAWARKEHLLS